MLRILVVLMGLLLIVGAPLADARGKPASPPGQEKDHRGKGHAEPASAPPADKHPPSSPSPRQGPPASSPPAAAPAPDAPAAPAPEEPRETARIVALDVGLIHVPSLPPHQSAAVASVPIANPAAPGGGSLPSWTWLLPAIGLVSAGATLLVVRKGRAPPVQVATQGPAMRIANATVPSLLRAGKAALDEGRIEEAVAWFTQATKLDPRLAVGHFSRGVCLASLARHNEAYRALKKAHTLDPMEGAYRLELARAGARTGRGAEAMTLLASLIAVLPELAQDVADDDAFASLLDHPRFLLMVGRL